MELVEKNKLQILVEESGLETTKAQFLLEQFSNYFEIASEWEKKAKSIVVTDESQTAEMEMARTGRLFLRDKRISVEKARKKLKEQSLREGKAIDGIANVLKAVIVPIEEYLSKQEKFIEIKREAELEAKRKEIERRMEEERIAEEKAKAEAEEKERERIRLENERLKAEAIEREKAAEVERQKAEAERQKQEKIIAEQKAKAEAERVAQEAELAKQKAEAEAERRAVEEKARKEREAIEAKANAERERVEKERLAAEAERQKLEEQLNQIECPFCHKTFQMKG